MNFKTLFIAAALCSAGFAQADTNLVANGSFELGAGGIGSFTGWQTTLGDPATFVDSSGQTGTQAGQASAGLWSAYFGSTQADGGATISQQFATTIGQTYQLSYFVANDNAGAAPRNAIDASLGNAVVQSFTNLADQGYSRELVSFTATAAVTTLAFSAYNDSGYVQLDDVAVIAAVPEPSTAWLSVGGLVLIGLRLQSRRRRA